MISADTWHLNVVSKGFRASVVKNSSQTMNCPRSCRSNIKAESESDGEPSGTRAETQVPFEVSRKKMFFTPVGCSGDPPQCTDTLPVRVDFLPSKGSKMPIWDIDSQCRLYYLQNRSIIRESVDEIQTRIPAPCSNCWILTKILRNKKKAVILLKLFDILINFDKKVRFWMQIGDLCWLISQDSKIKFWILWTKIRHLTSQDLLETKNRILRKLFL